MARILKNGVEYGVGGQTLIDKIYPVGSIYISTSASFNPQTAWGGTWKKTADGRCLIGANTSYPLGSTGGVESHYLVAAIGATDNDSSRIGYAAADISPFQQKRTYKYTVRGTEASSLGTPTKKFNHSVNVTDGKIDASNDGYTSNMQPYLAVYIWERIA